MVRNCGGGVEAGGGSASAGKRGVSGGTKIGIRFPTDSTPNKGSPAIKLAAKRNGWVGNGGRTTHWGQGVVFWSSTS